MTPPGKADILDGLRRLPGISPAVQAILPRLGDEGFNVNELAGMVAKDPVLAARILRLANSPFYGLSRQVGSLREAVTFLGFGNLRGLVLSAGLIHALSGADAGAAARGLATAAAARTLARSLGPDSGQAFTAGLLHNLGELLLGHFAPEHWRALATDPGETASDRLQQEQRTFGFDHCELGADIAGLWHFPAAIQAAIRSHPRPPDEPAEALTDLVHAAWVIGGGAAVAAIAPAVSRRLGLDSEAGKAALDAARQDLRELDKDMEESER